MSDDTKTLSECWMRFISDVMQDAPIQREEYRSRQESFICGSTSTLAVVSGRLLDALGGNSGDHPLTGAEIMGILQETFNEAAEMTDTNRRGSKNA